MLIVQSLSVETMEVKDAAADCWEEGMVEKIMMSSADQDRRPQ